MPTDGKFERQAGIIMETPMQDASLSAEHYRNVLSAMADADWDALYLDLIGYTMSRIADNYWMSVWNGRKPGGKEAHDIVMRALESILEGKRKPAPNLPLAAVFKMTIKSDVDHLMEGLENRRTQELHDEEDQEESRENLIPDGGDAPNKIAADNDAEQQNAKLLDLLMDELSDDKALMDLLGCLMDGIEKREEIAKALKITPDEVTNLRKRFDRRLPKFWAKYAGQFPLIEVKE
jgi:hypothetical protein